MLVSFGPGDDVLVPYLPLLQAPRQSCVLVKRNFCEIDPETMLLDIEDVKEKITSKTKGIVAGLCDIQ